MADQYVANVMVGEYKINELSLLFFEYGVAWDRGNFLRLLIHDPSMSLHRLLEDADGTPSLPITFQLEYLTSRGASYENKGEEHKVFIWKIGVVTTPIGMAVRIIAMDKASLMLRRDSSAYHAQSIKAHEFIQNYTKRHNIESVIPTTGDNAGLHRANHGKPLSVIRYELDRVLSSGGKPISLQFDDRIGEQKLIGFEELYDGATQLLEDSFAAGTYEWGTAQSENGGRGGTYGTVAYHYEMDTDISNAMWGHTVSVNQLLSNNSVVAGKVEKKLAAKLGINPDTFDKSHRRIVMPRTYIDSPTSDEYYSRATMVNAVFHSEMAMTRGALIVDPDYTAFDGVELLNRTHIVISITGGSNEASQHSIIPQEAVVMGYSHVINQNGAFTKVLVRRGN